MTDTLNTNEKNNLGATEAPCNNRHGQLPEAASVELEFSTPPALDDVNWHIIVGKNGDRLSVIEDADVEMLFARENAGLLYSMYSTVEHLMEPDEVELTVCTAYVKGENDKSDWSALATDIKESGMRMTARVLLRLDEVVTFCDAISSVMARQGECRCAEFMLGDEIIADYVSSGDNLWEYYFCDSAYSSYLTAHQSR